MQDFKRFMSFVGKEFNHILRDTRALMVLIVMPVVMIVLFGFALSTEIKDVKVAVYDPSRDAATSRLISQIDASEYFTVTAFLDGEDGVLEAFRSNSADIALVFEDNFYHRAVHDSDGRLQVIVDGSNTNIGSMAVFYVSSIVSSFQKELAQEAALNQAAAGGSSSAEAVSPVQIRTSTRMMYNPQMKSAFNFVPGVMGMILMLVCAMMTSVSIVREKERGTMEVLLVSPVKPFSVILAKAIPYFVVSAFILLIVLCLSVFLIKVPISGSLMWVVLVSLLFILVSLSIGILISTLVAKQEVAILISGMVLMLPTMLLSGMLFPIESMPKVLQWISYCVPAKWYIDSIKVMMIQGLGIRYCLDAVLILCGFLTVITGLSVFKFKDRL
ncbi:MAG TPA: ABC transporter permease [Candidatus Coprenecus stercoravium]|uniref:Transport permease protein n=1 Tax=Candidatus Coprenecus stercoravium TaxID=2840735 RepID=A0A9D2K9A4_9BACT|nr:ABC transporter permease [Candidatus Coprenecus stercoravium]